MSASGRGHRALILAPFGEAQLARLLRRVDVNYESWMETRALWDPEELGLRLREDGCDILVVEVDFVFEEVFEAAPGLGLVGVCRAATNHVDVEAATRHGVLVVNTPGRNAQAVAEHTLGLMFSLARRIPEGHGYVTNGHWRNPLEPYMSLRGIELSGRTLGVVGLGAVGRRLASIANGIGMSCIAHDPYLSPPVEGVRLVELDDLLAEADFVSIHAPLTATTWPLIRGSPERATTARTVSLLSYRLSDAADVDLEQSRRFAFHEPVTDVHQHRLLTRERKQIDSPADGGPAILAVFLVQPDGGLRVNVRDEDRCDPDGIRSDFVELLAEISGIKATGHQCGLFPHLAQRSLPRCFAWFYGAGNLAPLSRVSAGSAHQQNLVVSRGRAYCNNRYSSHSELPCSERCRTDPRHSIFRKYVADSS